MPRGIPAPAGIPAKRKKKGVNATADAATLRIEKLRRDHVEPKTHAELALLDPNRPLTDKMKQFVKNWAQGETILSAAVRAGYTDGGSMAYKLAKDPAILQIYNAEKKAYEEASGMTKKKVMDMLVEAYEMGKIMSEGSTMVAAAREIGKMCGYFEPIKKEINLNVTGNVLIKKLENMSDEKLLEMIENNPNVIDQVMKEVHGDEDDDQ